MNWELVVGLINIVIIDLALSGDNAIVIGMAAASLPRDRRNKAILLGGAGAISLRIALTAVATTLMRITLISAVAGVALCWVAWKLVRMDVQNEEENKGKQANNFRQAVYLILAADFMMSVDNVLAVAGAAHGSYPLLIAGLLISMPLLMTTGGFISRMIDKVKWLPVVGGAVIIFTAARMILTDGFIQSHVPMPASVATLFPIVVGLLSPAGFSLANKLRSKRVSKDLEL